MTDPTVLPVPVLSGPHWRVNIRPDTYREVVPSVSECLAIIETTKVRLRGWDYPHLSSRSTQQQIDNDWVASWAEFSGHTEYWRFYQSGQFLHLFSVREAFEAEWKADLLARARHVVWDPAVDWGTVKGALSVENFIYTVTEIFEFATRLSQRGLYSGSLSIDIAISGIQGFILMAGKGRSWHGFYVAQTDSLRKEWLLDTRDLVATSAQLSLRACDWFFQRFGWRSGMDVFVSEQQKFLKGLL